MDGENKGWRYWREVALIVAVLACAVIADMLIG